MTETLIDKWYRCEKHGLYTTTYDVCMSFKKQLLLEYKDNLNAKARAYRIKTKEAFSIREKHYYIGNKEAVKVKSEIYKLKAKDAIALRDNQYDIETGEILLTRNKEHRIQNNENIALYNQKTIECVPCEINHIICSTARHCKLKIHQNKSIQTETIDNDIKS